MLIKTAKFRFARWIKLLRKCFLFLNLFISCIIRYTQFEIENSFIIPDDPENRKPLGGD